MIIIPSLSLVLSLPSLSLCPLCHVSLHCCRDSYWIMRGLLLCNMTETAKNIILNMVSMVER